MFRLSAILTILCLGYLLPMAGAPLRVCLMDIEERTEDCCADCDTAKEGCCLDVQPIPPAPLAKGIFEMPDFDDCLIGGPVAHVPAPTRMVVLPSWARPAPSLGPPSAVQARLNVWRL